MSAGAAASTLFPTTIAGSLPKPAWLAAPNKLWAPWRLEGAELAEAKRDATLLALKLQEDAGIDIVSDGEQSRQHFVHGFLEAVEGIDFDSRVEMGIRNDRYKAMCPTVIGAAAAARARACPRGAAGARPYQRKLKFTLPGPMTIVDTIADAHYGDRVKMAIAFAALLNEEARGLAADGVDVIQFDEPAFNVYMDEAAGWGIGALHRAIEASPQRPPCISATATASPPISRGRPRSGASGGNTSNSFRRWRRAASTRSRSNASSRMCR